MRFPIQTFGRSSPLNQIQLLRSLLFHRTVQSFQKKVREVRHGKDMEDMEDMGGTKLDYEKSMHSTVRNRDQPNS